jgi:hypothetical protein
MCEKLSGIRRNLVLRVYTESSQTNLVLVHTQPLMHIRLVNLKGRYHSENQGAGKVKYHTMNMYLLLNQTPGHEDVLESGGIAPRILNLGTRWRSAVSFKLWPLYPQGNSPPVPIG